MNSERADRIKNIIEESGSFALLLNENAQEHEMLARKTLEMALESKGKSVCTLPETPNEFKERWSAILPAGKRGSFIHANTICIPKDKLNIKEISYENAGDFFVINIKSENNKLCKEDIIIESEPAEIGAIFSMGKMDSAYLAKLKNKISPSSENKIISINQNGGCVSEKIYDIIKKIDATLLSQNNIPTLLFASLLLEKVSCRGQSDGKTPEMERDLIRMGANKKLVNEIIMDFLSLDHLPVI